MSLEGNACSTSQIQWNEKILSVFEKEQQCPFWKMFLSFHCLSTEEVSFLGRAIRIAYCSKVRICLIKMITPPGLLSHVCSDFKMLRWRVSLPAASSGAGVREEELRQPWSIMTRASKWLQQHLGSAQHC